VKALRGSSRASAAVALAAFALFTLEPFAGKVLLPRLGGTPMVWNTCVMVFQALLLGGYLYSVWLSRHPSARRLHFWLSVAAIVSWPLSVRLLWMTPPNVSSVLWISWVITIGAGLPFVLLSSTSPLMQVWSGDRAGTTDTHRLYSVSNVASVGALIAYVAVVEPFLGLRSQTVLIWILLAAVTFIVGGNSDAIAAAPGSTTGVKPRLKLKWMVLSFAASLILYSVNTYLATDVASFPLLFIVPLGLFLLGFAAGFSAWAERWGRIIEGLAMIAAAAALWYLLKVASQ
jgi:hypothetical protein